ncbi:hypothetical protein AMATHDRAFT_67234 [Amanita thiersii Skay4041]|uniref:NadR/Ttd14 AAA domain-containing protein n=1 Tax=Amanita thiersii Skay4041 TaxID=703135 RepID=A0A2A9NJ23_9AGAR|nr:hypothetical protein AMATHDRAFT_67234 [Amanita thiersii Skay4041]
MPCSQSTGKTTLCAALAKHLDISGTSHVTEVARQVIREKGYTRNDIGLLQMQEDIMMAHLRREHKVRIAASTPAAPSGDGRQVASLTHFVLCDRSAIDPIVYALLLSKDDTTIRQERYHQLTRIEAFEQVLPLYQQPSKSLFFLLEPIEEWVVDDGVRMIENQNECFLMFRDVLECLSIRYSVIGKEMKSLSDRVKLVVRALKQE